MSIREIIVQLIFSITATALTGVFLPWPPAIALSGRKDRLFEGTNSSPHTCGHSPLFSPNQWTQAQFLPSLGATLASALANSTKEAAAGYPFSWKLNGPQSQVQNVTLQANWQAPL